MKHKTEDYKLSAVTYYNNNDDGYDKTCNIFASAVLLCCRIEIFNGV